MICWSQTVFSCFKNTVPNALNTLLAAEGKWGQVMVCA
jgi:hypothetical protein